MAPTPMTSLISYSAALFGHGGFEVDDGAPVATPAPGTLAELCEGDGGEEVDGGVAPGVVDEETFVDAAACSVGGGLSLLMSSAMLAIELAHVDFTPV